MKIIPLEPALAQSWDHVANNSEDAWLFHLYDWLPLTEQCWGLEAKSFLVEWEGKVVGIFPLQLKRNSKSLKSTYMGFGGAALLSDLQEGVRKKILKAMYEQAYLIASQNKSPFIEVLLSPLSEISLQNKWQVNPLIHYFYEDISTHTSIIDLNITEEEIIFDYSDDTRRQIKSAHEAGYAVSPVTDLSEIDALYRVHCENRERTSAEIQPKEFFYGVFKHYCQKGFAVMLQAKDPKGVPVAFRSTGHFKKGAMSWMASCTTSHLDSGVNYLLHHHSILWSKKQGARYFETGEVFPNIQEGKLHGLSVFKTKFGGQLHRLFKGRVILENPGKLKRAINGASRAYNTLMKQV